MRRSIRRPVLQLTFGRSATAGGWYSWSATAARAFPRRSATESSNHITAGPAWRQTRAVRGSACRSRAGSPRRRAGRSTLENGRAEAASSDSACRRSPRQNCGGAERASSRFLHDGVLGLHGKFTRPIVRMMVDAFHHPNADPVRAPQAPAVWPSAAVGPPGSRTTRQEDSARGAFVRRDLLRRLRHRTDADRARRAGIGGVQLRRAYFGGDRRAAGARRAVVPPDDLRLPRRRRLVHGG